MTRWAVKERHKDYTHWRIHQGPRDALDNLPLYILAAEKDARGPSRPARRRVEFYSLSWLKEGDCWYWSEMRRRSVRVQVGQVITVTPDLLHAYGGHGKPFLEDYVVFSGPVADGFRALGILDPERPFLTLLNPGRLGQIVDIVKQSSVEAQLRAGLILQELLVEARFDTSRSASTHYPSIQKLIRAIAADPAVHWSNTQMARFCGLGQSRFRTLFREDVGITPAKYCEQIRMDKACILLSRSDQLIGRIATSLGYDDPLYFSKRFRAVVGISPRAYRQSAQK